ncbi:MAG TPA: zinc ribbon domain-containing protein [Kiritimatiellia bacterium]|jgi:predicted RNA-binding Zn-ribbon protein involved in translation (DUF1610 family)
MQNKTFDSNPLTGRLIALTILCVVGYAAGVLIILFDESFITGVAVIVATTIGEAILIADAVSNLSCPGCGDRLHRDRKAGKHVVRYICVHCETRWELPGKSRPPPVEPPKQDA